MKFRHNILICLAGAVWLVMGIFLLSLGIRFILESLQYPAGNGRFSVIAWLQKYISDPTQAIILVMTLSLFIGYFKGRMVLAKSVNRQINHIESLPNPAHIKHLYSKSYYLLIALMIGLGFSLRFLPITVDTRGAIDMTIGSALINGAMLYYRALSQKTYLKKKHCED